MFRSAGGHTSREQALSGLVFSPGRFLSEFKGGNSVYTAALVNQGLQVVDWTLHEERLASGMQALHAENASNYKAVFDGLPQEPQAVLRAVQAVVNPLVERCVEELAMAVGKGRTGMLIVLLVNNGMGTSDHHASPAQGVPALEAQALVAPCNIPPFDHAVQAAIIGRPRSLPHVKHTNWVQERKPLEQQKPKDNCAEVLLMDESGGILEGLVTNFCVICDHPSLPGLALMTAGGSHPALEGIMAKRVGDACAKLGIPVIKEPPRAGSRHTWREAFLTNCIRGLQPLSRVSCLPGNAWGHDPWDFELPNAPGPITRALNEHIRPPESLAGCCS
ncbi:aminotransferase [Dunaliella salina]|uniref:Aminotransferase n=1 Tax=Dunaliella salina TaxID=3046 RepID=A0ABQ7GC80_DUNSA|nr:aminotransferase [Dunaliella salina]|eukprot:KAF5832215.1 aminotransferase [Dunaliella salina]